MLSYLFQTENLIGTFVLIFLRIFGMVVIAPIFRNRNVPYIVKIGFIFLLSNILITRMSLAPVAIEDGLLFALIMAKELFIGAVIGFSSYLVFSVLIMVGQFIDMQIGFSMVSVFDPMNRTQITITANFYYYVLILIALVSNLHHFLLRALLDSFELIPIGSLVFNVDVGNNFIYYMTRYFELTLSFAAPIVFVTLITNVVLGILARVVPSLNMFVIGFPLKIFFGLATILVMITAFSTLGDTLMTDSQRLIRDSILIMTNP